MFKKVKNNIGNNNNINNFNNDNVVNNMDFSLFLIIWQYEEVFEIIHSNNNIKNNDSNNNNNNKNNKNLNKKENWSCVSCTEVDVNEKNSIENILNKQKQTSLQWSEDDSLFLVFQLTNEINYNYYNVSKNSNNNNSEIYYQKIKNRKPNYFLELNKNIKKNIFDHYYIRITIITKSLLKNSKSLFDNFDSLHYYVPCPFAQLFEIKLFTNNDTINNENNNLNFIMIGDSKLVIFNFIKTFKNIDFLDNDEKTNNFFTWTEVTIFNY
jgi:hypothetical protein